MTSRRWCVASRDVAQDDLLGPMFNDVPHVAGLNTSEADRLLVPGVVRDDGLRREPVSHTHRLIHSQRAFTATHFDRWLELFYDTVEVGWAGPNAEKVKALAGQCRTCALPATHRRPVHREGEGLRCRFPCLTGTT